MSISSSGLDRLDPAPTSNESDYEDPEDILSTSLETFYGYRPITLGTAGTTFVYVAKDNDLSFKITLRIPDTQATNWALHASDIWISSIYLADHLNELHLEDYIGKPLRVLELGAAAGLPGILIAKKFPSCAVTVSDYPDDQLIQNLTQNVECNGVVNNCHVVPYAWGRDAAALINGSDGFDLVIAADTLWNLELHEVFTRTLCATLSKAFSSRIFIVAGLHTGRYMIQAFLNSLSHNGLEIETILEKECFGCGEREWNTFREDEDDREKRRWVVWMKIRRSLTLFITG